MWVGSIPWVSRRCRLTWIQWLGNVIFRLSPSYIPDRPESLPAEVFWPEKEDIVDSLATVANLKWPYVLSMLPMQSDFQGRAYPSLTLA